MAKYTPAQAAEGADPGDIIEYSITEEVKTRQGRSFWVKAGLSSTVRDDEDGLLAANRVTEYVTNLVASQVAERLAN